MLPNRCFERPTKAAGNSRQWRAECPDLFAIAGKDNFGSASHVGNGRAREIVWLCTTAGPPKGSCGTTINELIPEATIGADEIFEGFQFCR